MAEIELPEFGIFEADITPLDKEYNERSPKGYFTKPAYATLVKQTDKIPLQKNLIFGLKFKLNNLSLSPIVLKILHPEMENPETGYCFTETLDFSTDSEGYFLHTFEYNWEMLPGFWSFQLIHNDHILTEKEFEIYVLPSLENEEEENFFYDM